MGKKMRIRLVEHGEVKGIYCPRCCQLIARSQDAQVIKEEIAVLIVCEKCATRQEKGAKCTLTRKQIKAAIDSAEKSSADMVGVIDG